MIKKFTGSEWFGINENEHLIKPRHTNPKDENETSDDSDDIGFKSSKEIISIARKLGIKIKIDADGTLADRAQVIFAIKDARKRLGENLGTGGGQPAGGILTVGKNTKHYMPGDLKKEEDNLNKDTPGSLHRLSRRTVSYDHGNEKEQKKSGEFNIANTKPGARGSVKSPWRPSSFAKGTEHWKKNEENKPKEGDNKKKARRRFKRGGTYGMGDSHAGDSDDD